MKHGGLLIVILTNGTEASTGLHLVITRGLAVSGGLEQLVEGVPPQLDSLDKDLALVIVLDNAFGE